MEDLGGWGVPPCPEPLLPACVALPARAELPAQGSSCVTLSFALSSSDAVTWADPHWKPPEDVGDPQGVERQGRALNREGLLTLRCP